MKNVDNYHSALYQHVYFFSLFFEAKHLTSKKHSPAFRSNVVPQAQQHNRCNRGYLRNFAPSYSLSYIRL